MEIVLDILKFIVVLVYLFFFLDSVMNLKFEFFDEKSKDLSWLDVVYLVYAGVNFVLIVKVLHG